MLYQKNIHPIRMRIAASAKLRSVLLIPLLVAVLSTSASGHTGSVCRTAYNKRQFSAFCQYWINTLINEGGYRFTRLDNYELYKYDFDSEDKDHSDVRFEFDKLQLTLSCEFTPKYYDLTVGFTFHNKEDANAFISSVIYTKLKNIAKRLDTLRQLEGYQVYYVYGYSISFDQNDEYKRIFSGGITTPYPFDVKKAFDFFEQRALQPISPGENMVTAYREKGNCYYNGAGVLRNINTARQYYEKAWELGDDTAALFLGYIYTNPYEAKLLDVFRAKAYFDSACQSGNTDGFYCIGALYETDSKVGIKYDIATAIGYYEKGARKGNIVCLNVLYRIYSTDKDFANPEKAKEYKERIAYMNEEGSFRNYPGVFVRSLNITK